MNNEKGYVLFPALCVLSLLLILIASSTEAFLVEKRFSQEVHNRMLSTHLLQLAVVDCIVEAGENLQKGDAGTLLYDHGQVSYKIEDRFSDTVQIHLRATVEKGGSAAFTYLYSLTERKVIEWL
ncbi:MAG: competence type IV pilus minor pilin ComGG [Bacillus sp. (in: firmicutes)]